MSELKLGKMTTTELATWFGIAYGTFRNRKEFYLTRLQQYCEFTPQHGGVLVTEIHHAEYVGDLNNDAQIYLDEVKKHPLNSISNIAEQVSKNEEYKNLSKVQLERRMSNAGVLGFGITGHDGSRGIYGTRDYKWCIKTYDVNEPYRELTTKEQQVFDKLTSQVFGEHPEIAQRLYLLDKEFRKSDMTKEEYLNHKDKINFDATFDRVIFEFKAATGKQIVKATSHDILAW